ncbi:MAG TPA: hypothetical protein VM182_06660 [Terriglobia bacterium]|nr:hypothetical protein [Terriglobia bacterium]
MSVFAAIDVGSNSVRLRIARVVGHRLQTIHEDRTVTRLGESVFRSGILAPQAMDATVLSGEDDECVPRAAVLLRLAKAMNHGPGGNIKRVAAVLDARGVNLRLTARKSADLEVWLLQKEKDLFLEVFGRELVLDVS